LMVELGAMMMLKNSRQIEPQIHDMTMKSSRTFSIWTRCLKGWRCCCCRGPGRWGCKCRLHRGTVRTTWRSWNPGGPRWLVSWFEWRQHRMPGGWGWVGDILSPSQFKMHISFG
jgi:hypothetical protein